jgi:hypothetical protein
MSDERPATPPAEPPPASLGQVARAVAWSFFGVRKGHHMADDARRIRPLQVVVVGVAAAVLLVVALIALVRVIVAGAG